MDLKERAYSILAVSASAAFNTALQNTLPAFRCDPLCFAGSVSQAKRMLLERSYDFVVVNSPLPDDAGLRFCIDACHDKTTVALVFVKAELYAATHGRLSEHGVYVLSKPVSRSMLLQAIDWMGTTRQRLERLEKKTLSIEEKMQEIRLVNRAKWLLIDRMGLSEADAHRLIEKQAMDSCTTRRAIAESILKTYS